MKCLNCDNDVVDNFCSNCGQKTTTHRFSLKHVFSNGILNGIFMVNKGVLFTLKELFTRPGHSIREYNTGKRVAYFNAFSLMLLLITITYFIDQYSDLKLSDLMDDNKGFADSLTEFMEEYPRFIYMMNIPIMALTSYWFFRKKSKVNYAESIILNTYIISGQIILTLPFTLLSVFYTNKSVLTVVFQIIQFFPAIYTFWVYYQYFSKYKYKKKSLIFKSLFSVLLFTILQSIMSAAIVLIKTYSHTS